MSEILIAYYSHSGNTQEIAEQIEKLVGGTIFRIEPVEKYPRNYHEVLKVSKVEIENDIRPPLAEQIEEISQYNSIFIGSPNWYSTIAPPVTTFLSENDLSGKTVIPFVTHGGGGVAHCITDIERLVPDSTVLEGFVISGSRTGNAKSKLQEWLEKIQIPSTG
ncbi:MAG: flavodoxin [Candidatus Thorarchaeota archaeon]